MTRIAGWRVRSNGDNQSWAPVIPGNEFGQMFISIYRGPAGVWHFVDLDGRDITTTSRENAVKHAVAYMTRVKPPTAKGSRDESIGRWWNSLTPVQQDIVLKESGYRGGIDAVRNPDFQFLETSLKNKVIHFYNGNKDVVYAKGVRK